MTIDLTPAELREWAKIGQAPCDSRTTGRYRELSAKLGSLASAPLALALADAMEERDECIRVAGEAIGTDESLRNVGCVQALATWAKQMREEKSTLRIERDKSLSNIEAAREAIRNCTSLRENGNYECRFGVVPDRVLPAVRAAWEGK